MGLFGAEWELWANGRSSRGLGLSVVGDMGWSSLSVVEGAAAGVSAKATRARLGLRAGHESRGGAWASELRASGRADGAEDDAGGGAAVAGLEVSGSLRHVLGRRETLVEGLWFGGDGDGTGGGGSRRDRGSGDLRPAPAPGRHGPGPVVVAGLGL